MRWALVHRLIGASAAVAVAIAVQECSEAHRRKQGDSGPEADSDYCHDGAVQVGMMVDVRSVQSWEQGVAGTAPALVPNLLIEAVVPVMSDWDRWARSIQRARRERQK